MPRRKTIAIEAPIQGFPDLSIGEMQELPVDTGKEGDYLYYRHPVRKGNLASGWICTGGAHEMEQLMFIRRGFTPLPQYGRLYLMPPKGLPSGFLEPWRQILAFGGAKEFPLEQILAYRWHRRPPYPDVEFPQLRGYKYETHACTLCDEIWDTDSLLARHMASMHTKEYQAERQRALFKELVQEVSGHGTAASNETLAAAILKLAEGLAQSNMSVAQVLEKMQTTEKREATAPAGS